MDLKKFKLISTIFLAGALLFLSVILIVNKNQADYLPVSAAEDLSALFAAHGIALPADAIPLRREKLPVYSVPTANGTDAQRIAEAIGGSARAAANLTQDGYLFRLENGGIVEISKFLTFSYSRDGATYDGLPDGAELLDASAARAAANVLLSRINMNTEHGDDLVCDYSLTECYAVGTNALLGFEIRLNGLEVADNSLTVYRDADGNIIYAKGNYVFSPLKKETGFSYYDIINVLMAELDCISQDGKPGSAIESIEPCYVMEPAEDGSRVLLIPAWRICYETGVRRLHQSVRSE